LEFTKLPDILHIIVRTNVHLILAHLTLLNDWYALKTANVEMGIDVALRKRIKENVYLVVVEGFQLLSEWTGRVWQQSAWKFSRPAKDSGRFNVERLVDVTDYEKVLFLSVRKIYVRRAFVSTSLCR
jgi:hypothetical protein